MPHKILIKKYYQDNFERNDETLYWRRFWPLSFGEPARLPDLINQAGMTRSDGGLGEVYKHLKSQTMKMIKFKKDTNGFAALRKMLGLTQEQLAGELNVSRSLVSMVEKGERSFSLEALVKLSELEVAMLAKQQAEDPRRYLQHTHSIYIQIISSY